MTQYQRKPKPVEAFQWERNSDPKTWPEWARLYRAQDGMGSLSGLATSGVGTLLIPALPSSKHAESGQWLVFEGEIVDVEGGARVARGPVLVMTTDQFEAEFEPVGPARNAPEPAPEAPAAETLWIKCPETGQLVFHKDVEANNWVIPGSEHHLRIDATQRLKLMFDGGTWIDVPLPETPPDPLKFRDEKRYVDRLRDARAKTGMLDAFKIGFGRVEALPGFARPRSFSF